MNILLHTCAILFLIVISSFAEDVTVQNNCGRDIFVKNENANSGSFNLGNGESRSFTVDRERRVRVWAHAGCDGNGNNCDTVEGYVSLAEFNWDGNGKTWFDISQVDGYNLPTTMQAYSNTGGNCDSTTCFFNIDNDCPQDNKKWKDGRAVACENPNRDSPTPYSDAIKRSCPRVYAWSKDDTDGMRDCQPGNPGLHVTFC